MFRFDSFVNLIKRLQNVFQSDKKDGKDKDIPKWLLCIFIVDLLGTEFPINISLCAGKFTPPNHHKCKFWQYFISPVSGASVQINICLENAIWIADQILGVQNISGLVPVQEAE